MTVYLVTREVGYLAMDEPPKFVFHKRKDAERYVQQLKISDPELNDRCEIYPVTLK